MPVALTLPKAPDRYDQRDQHELRRTLEAALAQLNQLASTSSSGALTPSGVTPGTYGDATDIPVVTFDINGIATGATTVPAAGGGAVTSVFTRTGAVVAAGGDYSVAQVTGAAPLASPALTGTPNLTTSVPASQSILDTGLTLPGYQVLAPFGTQPFYYPGVTWSDTTNNSTKPKAGIYVLVTSAGVCIVFGMSGSYATGITQHALFNYNGGVTLGNITLDTTHIHGVMQAAGTGLTSMTQSTAAGNNQSNGRLDLLLDNGNYATLDFAEQVTNPNQAFCRIGAVKGGSGSSLLFGVSNNYSSGITSTAMQLNYDNSMQMYGLLTKYNNIATVAQGTAPIYAKADLTAQSAAVGPTTLYAVPAGGAGQYRISWSAVVTTAATASSTLGGAGGFQVTFTDNDTGTAITPLTDPSALGTGNAIGTQINGVTVVNAKASTNIQYSFGYTSSGVTAMQYALHMKCDYLG